MPTGGGGRAGVVIVVDVSASLSSAGGAMGGAARAAQATPHASLAMVQGLSYSSASVCVSPVAAATSFMVRFAATSAELPSVLQAAGSISIIRCLRAPRAKSRKSEAHGWLGTVAALSHIGGRAQRQPCAPRRPVRLPVAHNRCRCKRAVAVPTPPQRSTTRRTNGLAGAPLRLAQQTGQ